MKIIRCVAIVLVLMAVLGGCHPTGRATDDYRRRAFRAEVRFTSGEVTVYAEVETEQEGEGVSLSRARLLAPPSLAGIELVRKEGELLLLRDGLEMHTAGAQGWWDTLSLLCASGTLRYICDTELAGLSLEYAEITDGTRTVEVLRERETGIPKRITEGDRSLTVIRFEPIEARENT